jgi:glyoxylase-like metal-dependent hydrolase (beta-lactamase superfamily II)
MPTPDRPNPLPRELAPGLFWLGECYETPYQGRPLHMYNSVFLIRGSAGSMMVEAGNPLHLDVVEEQVAGLLDEPDELRHIWVTHQETPHAAGLGRLLERFPAAEVRADVRDYHLVFPRLTDRFRPLAIGESIDLGDRQFTALQPIIKDLISTQWGYDSLSHGLFPGDAYAYAHYHEDDHCGKLAEEAPELPIADLAAIFAELALYWWTFTDMEPYVAAIQQQLDELEVELIMPTHGLPIADVDAIVPRILDGLRLGARRHDASELLT